MEVLLTELLRVSERASHIARLCRAEKALFELLVEEKVGQDKNKRFAQDFKTLADVLIQETFRYYLGGKFPFLLDYICGEEVNTFTNPLGESIVVQVCATEDETSALLTKVLDGNVAAARLLAKAVHVEVTTPGLTEDAKRFLSELDVDLGNIGVWIDPLDGTNEYVHGKEATEEGNQDTIHAEGLACVVVLVGAFDRRTGDPLIGAMTQPFWRHCPITGSWQSRQAWGVCAGGRCMFDVSPAPKPDACIATGRKRAVTSRSEDKAIKDALVKQGFDVVCAAGAGYKALCVVDSSADIYVLSKGSTYQWDTCGPQAILRAMGGDIADWSKACQSGKVTKDEALKYSTLSGHSEEHSHKCNTGGVIAFRCHTTAQSIASYLCHESKEATGH